MNTKKNVLVGCCGSVAAIKLPVVLNLLKKRDPSIQVSENELLLWSTGSFHSRTLWIRL